MRVTYILAAVIATGGVKPAHPPVIQSKHSAPKPASSLSPISPICVRMSLSSALSSALKDCEGPHSHAPASAPAALLTSGRPAGKSTTKASQKAKTDFVKLYLTRAAIQERHAGFRSKDAVRAHLWQCSPAHKKTRIGDAGRLW